MPPNVPMCEVCQMTAPDKPQPASLLVAFPVSFGAAKSTKWLPCCEHHYNGGPVFLLTPVPELFTNAAKAKQPQ